MTDLGSASAQTGPTPSVKAPALCAVEGCDRSSLSLDRGARGWCSKHYQRWLAHGDPTFRLTSSEIVHGTYDGYSNHDCRCAECREAFRIAYGMQHHARALRLGRCSIAACDGYQYAKGYCHAHYERQRTGRDMHAPIHRKYGARIFEP